MNKEISKILQESGYRVTKPRLKVLEILHKSKKPLNPYEISEKSKSTLDVSTIYRILQVFKKLGLTHYVKDKNGYIACQKSECKKSNHCHHQFVCQKCEEITEIHLDDQKFLKTIKSEFKNMQLTSHYFEFSGICNNCKN